MEELSKIIMESSMSDSFQDEFESKTEFSYKPKRIRKLLPGVCEYCDKYFSDRRHLYAHIRIHTGEKPFVCSVCHKGFNQNSNLRRHFEIHTERKTLHCNVCERQFIDKQHFKDHVQAHTGIKPYVCQICNKRFAYRNSLVCHRVTHKTTHHKGKKVKDKKDREIKFFCEICNEGFVYENLLKYHMRLHDKGIKSYQCTLCKRVFSRNTRFHSHLLSIHNIKIAFQCRHCDKRFPDQHDLGKHYLYDHKKGMELKITMQKEVISAELSKESDAEKKKLLSEIYKDIKIAFMCKICSDYFSDKETFEKHYLHHHKEEESSDLQKEETSRTESGKEIEYDSVKKEYLSDSVSEKEVEIDSEREQDSENDITQNEDACEFSSDSEKELKIQIELEHSFENDVIQNRDPCEVPGTSQENLEIKTEPQECFENDIEQTEYPCELSSGSQAELEIETEPEQLFNNDVIKNRYLCGICYEEFSYITSIQEHLRTHTLQYVFVCPKCRKCFESKLLLSQHACSTETETELLECYICEEKFSKKDDLKNHLYIHTKEDTSS